MGLEFQNYYICNVLLIAITHPSSNECIPPEWGRVPHNYNHVFTKHKIANNRNNNRNNNNHNNSNDNNFNSLKLILTIYYYTVSLVFLLRPSIQYLYCITSIAIHYYKIITANVNLDIFPHCKQINTHLITSFEIDKKLIFTAFHGSNYL